LDQFEDDVFWELTNLHRAIIFGNTGRTKCVQLVNFGKYSPNNTRHRIPEELNPQQMSAVRTLKSGRI
jgi:hypothetical protein